MINVGVQRAGVIRDSLYYDLDSANLVGKIADPANIGTIFPDVTTGFANNSQVKSGSMEIETDEFGYINFPSANVTGSILLPNQDLIGRTFLTTSSWTIEWWGWWNAITGRDFCVFSQGQFANNQGLHIQARSSKLQFAMFNSDLTSNANLVINRWTHFACVFQNAAQLGFRKTIYFNGVEDRTGTFATAFGGGPVGRPFVIGTNIWGGTIGLGSSGYNGRIGQCRIYGRALTASDVMQNFNATKNRFNIV